MAPTTTDVYTRYSSPSTNKIEVAIGEKEESGGCSPQFCSLRRLAARALYLFFFAPAGFGADLVTVFFAGLSAGFKDLSSGLAGLSFSCAFACGLAGAVAAGATGAAAGAAPFVFFPAFGPGFGAPAAAGASAAALAARPRLGAGGGGGGGGANGFRNFSVSVRERSFPSNRSMNTSWASLGYSGS
jgi:hypothetical protein